MTKSPIAESDLISLIIARDKKGAEALYDQFAPVLQLAVIRYVHDRDSVENIMENTFVRIWLNIGLFLKQDRPLLAWMLSLARLEAAEFLRVKDIAPGDFTDLPDTFETGLQLGL